MQKKVPYFRALGAVPPDPQNSPIVANLWLRACFVSILTESKLLKNLHLLEKQLIYNFAPLLCLDENSVAKHVLGIYSMLEHAGTF